MLMLSGSNDVVLDLSKPRGMLSVLGQGSGMFSLKEGDQAGLVWFSRIYRPKEQRCDWPMNAHDDVTSTLEFSLGEL